MDAGWLHRLFWRSGIDG